MTLAFLIYHYFPYGGQQRDFMQIAQRCCAAGHQVRVYCLVWEGDAPPEFEIHIVPVRAMSRHGLYQKYRAWVESELERFPVDAVIGFSKMPGLDVYFAADPCFAERMRRESRPWLRWLPRYRHFLKYERAVFAAEGPQVMLLSEQQRSDFLHHYPAVAGRLHRLPPGLAADRLPPGDNVAQRNEWRLARRTEFRSAMGFSDADLAILQVGSGFRIKGLDRSIRALAALPDELRARTLLLVVGDDKPGKYQRLAEKLDVGDRVRFLGGRDDVPAFLAGCDLMLHPAYRESAGYTLLEAVVNGLPVLTTDTCGYAWHVEQAQAGEVCPSPFDQEDLNARLLRMLTSLQHEQWSQNGLAYGIHADVTGMAEAALAVINATVAGDLEGELTTDAAGRSSVQGAPHGTEGRSHQ